MTDHTTLIDAYGSPLYRYDLDRVDAALTDLRDALPVGATVLYSLKANPHVDVVRTLVAGGCHAELSSTGELAAALAAGAVPADCLYTGPGKTAEEITTALEAGVTTFSVESVTDLHRVAGVARGLGRTVDCLLRVNGGEAPSGAGMRMTGEASQFGSDIEVLVARKAELDAPGARVAGFHFYPLTNAADEAGLLAELLGSIRTAARLRTELGVDVRLLDLGGGFACPFAREGERPRYTGLRAPLQAALDEHFPDGVRVFFESGRHLVGDSGTLLCTVSDVKDSRGARFAVLDTGIHHLGGLSGIGRLLPLSAEPLAANEAERAGEQERVRLVGPLCTPADTLGRGTPSLPNPYPGQVLEIPNVGAYGATASLIGFLSRPAAAEVAVRGTEVVSATRLSLERVPLEPRTTPLTTPPATPEHDLGPWDDSYPTVLRSVLPRLATPVVPDDSLRAAGLDSLALVELLVRLEDAFAVSIPDDALVPEAFATPASLWETVQAARA
jgi:diaminopimelate decarboxylase